MRARLTVTLTHPHPELSSGFLLQELVALGYSVASPCDRFGRTPETVALRQDQGTALEIVRRCLAAIDVQRLTRGFLARRKVYERRALAPGETSLVHDSQDVPDSETPTNTEDNSPKTG